MANPLSLDLRIGHTRKVCEKFRRRINCAEIDAEVAPKRPLHLLALTKTKQSMVDKDACESITNCAMHKSRGDCRVYATGQATDDSPIRTHEGIDLVEFALNE